MNLPQINSELNMLFNQQLAEYHEIQDLKAKLAKSQRRHLELCAQIQALVTEPGKQS